MRAKIAVQPLAHAAVAIDYIAQWALYFIANRATKAAASSQAGLIGHLEPLEAFVSQAQSQSVSGAAVAFARAMTDTADGPCRDL